MSKRHTDKQTLKAVWELTSIGVVGYLEFRSEKVQGPWPSPTAFWGSVAAMLRIYPSIDSVELHGVHGPSRLSEDTLTQLRTATVDAVRELVGPPMLALRVGGYITLQQSFGDHIALVRSGTSVVCPFCAAKAPAYQELHHCGVELEVHYTGPLARVAVSDVLATHKDSFFFPWIWNPTHPRISRDDLQKLAERWQEIKQ